MGDVKCKRIIDGKTYNTETATELGVRTWEDEFNRGSMHLYQTRFGAFFEYSQGECDYSPEDDFEKIQPLSPDEARAWLEKHYSWQPDRIEELFGEMPEAGSGEVKFTLRMPESLRNRLAAKAEENKQSLNAWMVRCLEGCAK